MIRLGPISINIMLGLAEYRFLTHSQMLQLNLGTNSLKTVWKHTSKLRSRSYDCISRIEYNTIMRIGRVEDVYYLTAKGFKLLNELDIPVSKNVYIPRASPQLTDDYTHRLGTIQFHIYLNKYLRSIGGALEFFDPYFFKKKVGKSFYAINSIPLDENTRIIPDAVAKGHTQKGSRYLLFELHNGRSIKRLVDQIYKHAVALSKRKTHSVYRIPRNQFYYVLIVLENSNAHSALIKAMQQHESLYEHIHIYFLCKSLQDIETESFNQQWTSILGQLCSLDI